MLLGWERGSPKFRWEKGCREGTDRNYVKGNIRKEKTPKSFSNCWILLMSSGLLKEPAECSHSDLWVPETPLLDFSDH